ncbi:MAG TPA: sigma-70 family RNA polymerase sigma factor [Candidatus Limnocylindria bacterium]|nr:sigma-70 family RNA polymerase sigma factor [Candidatus Limnocylindria bacterium]
MPQGQGETSPDLMQMYMNDLERVQELGNSDNLRLFAELHAGAETEVEFAEKRKPEDPEYLPPGLEIAQEEGEQVMGQLIEGNLGLVISIARWYQGRGLDLPDLIQEGTLGLMRSLEKFDKDKGFTPSTYATYWIRRFIKRALEPRRTTRGEREAWSQMTSIIQAEKELRNQRQEVTDEAVSELTLLGSEQIAQARRIGRIVSVLSLDGLAEDNAEGKPLELDRSREVADSAPGQDDRVLVKESQEKARQEATHQLSSLIDAQRELIYCRFGFDGGGPRLLADVAEKLGLGKIEAMQLETTAFEALGISVASQQELDEEALKIPQRPTPEQEPLFEMGREGLSLAEMSKRTGHAIETIKKILAGERCVPSGWRVRPRVALLNSPWADLLSDRQKCMVGLYDQGFDASEIAEYLGIGHRVAMRDIRQAKDKLADPRTLSPETLALTELEQKLFDLRQEGLRGRGLEAALNMTKLQLQRLDYKMSTKCMWQERLLHMRCLENLFGLWAAGMRWGR